MMKSEIVMLGDYVELVTGFPFKSSEYTSNAEDILLLRGDNIAQGNLRWENPKRWPSGKSDVVYAFALAEGDVVVAMDRPWIEAGLKWACVRKKDLPALLVQRVARLRARSGLEQAFLPYLIGCDEFTSYVKSITTGVNVPHISGPDIKKFRFPLPPRPTQRKIAGILTAYDQLIENNIRRMAVLEEMARALYREWFPGFWNLDGNRSINEGRKSVLLEDVAELNGLSINSKTVVPETIEYVDIASVSTGRIDLTQILRFEDAPGRARRQVRHGDVIWSNVRPNRRSFAFICEPPSNLVVSTGFTVISPAAVPAALLYFATSSVEFSDYLANRAKGAAYPAVSAPDFADAQMFLPAKELMSQFEDMAMPKLRLISMLHRRNANLRATRDLLLPRLISGEVDVSHLPDPGPPAV